MTDLASDVDTPSDAELISRVRGGDIAAYGDLFSRHKDAATRLSRQLVRGIDADDLVSEAFAKVLSVLQGGGGPDVAFRAYLLTAVRRLHVDRVRSGQRLQTTDDMTPFDPGVPFRDTAVAGFESGAAAKAFASLPERWQLVLWHLEVEGAKPADIAPLLGMSANSVSALAYRAREGLRQAFLTMHLSDISETDCRWVNEHLGAYVRKGLAKRDAGKVHDHLEGCRRCTAMYLELTEVNSNLAGIIAPLLLGAAATGYLASGGAGAAGVVSVALSRVRDFAVANTGAVAAGGVAAAVAAATVTAVALGAFHHDHRSDVTANPPSGISSSLSPGPSGGTSGSPGSSGSASPSAGDSAGDSASDSASASASSTPTPAPTLAPTLAPTPTVSPAAVLPSDLVSPGASATATDTPTSSPTDDPTAPASPDRVIGTPAVHPDGTVTVTVQNLRADDVIDITLTSDETTFTDPTGTGACTVLRPRQVQCTPGAAALLAGVAAPRAPAFSPAAAVGDYTVTLPLSFPADMVSDDVSVSVRIEGHGSTDGTVEPFRPTRTPTFDFPAPVVAQGEHTLDGDVDTYALTTTAVLPRRATGLTYTVTRGTGGAGDARFRASGSAGCTTSDDGSTLRCPDVTDGDAVVLPVQATSLADATAVDVDVTVAPVDDFVDPTPNDETTSVALSPGSDLGLSGLSVFSANPDRNARVTVDGSLAGIRAGQDDVTYTVTGDATFADIGNTGCDVTGPSMSCPGSDGDVALVLRTGQRDQATPVTISVAPQAPFVKVGTAATDADVTLPGRPTADYSLAALALTDHTLTGDTDHYVLTATLGDLPTGSSTVDFALSGGDSFAATQPSGCQVRDADDVECTGLASAGTVALAVDSTSTTTHGATVTVAPPDPFDDPVSDNDSQTVSGLRPGTDLVLDPHDLGSLHQNGFGNYEVTTTVTGVRTGLDEVDVSLSDDLSFVRSLNSACQVDNVDDTVLVCSGLADGDQLDFTVAADPSTPPADLTATVTPAGDFTELGNDNSVIGSLVPSYDFALTDLTRTGHTITGDTDHYTLSTSVSALPVDVATLALTGGTFAADQPTGCDLVDDTHLRCDGLTGGRSLSLAVDSTSTADHQVALTLQTPDAYDDPDPSDNTATLDVQPGVDLHLANLHPDNASPANDDDTHVVATTLTGVRDGVGSLIYTLTGAATFVRASVAGCTADGTTLTCTSPTDGDVTFTIRADDVHTSTPITIAVAAADPFVELDADDNTSSATLAPRPTYDFAMGALTTTAQTVTGSTDHYTLSSTVTHVPAGVGGLTFSVTGGTFAGQQDTDCTGSGSTVTCTGLGADRSIGFRVDSTTGDTHDVTISLQVPAAYDDPTTANDARTVSVQPGVDLTLGSLTPADPVPATNGATTVTGTLGGVRSGAVTFALTGAAHFTASTCTVSSPTTVTCASPSSSPGGQAVGFTLTPTSPTAATPVTITAQSAAGLLELDGSDNASSTTLAPDVVLASVTQRADITAYATLRAQVTGVPAGVSTVRFALHGASTGTGTGQVHFTSGASGADGEGNVDCYTSDANGGAVTNGLYATCTGVASAVNGSFYVDMRVAHQKGTTQSVTFEAIAVGADEGTHTANNSRAIDLH